LDKNPPKSDEALNRRQSLIVVGTEQSPQPFLNISKKLRSSYGRLFNQMWLC